WPERQGFGFEARVETGGFSSYDAFCGGDLVFYGSTHRTDKNLFETSAGHSLSYLDFNFLRLVHSRRKLDFRVSAWGAYTSSIGGQLDSYADRGHLDVQSSIFRQCGGIRAHHLHNSFRYLPSYVVGSEITCSI